MLYVNIECSHNIEQIKLYKYDLYLAYLMYFISYTVCIVYLAYFLFLFQQLVYYAYVLYILIDCSSFSFLCIVYTYVAFSNITISHHHRHSQTIFSLTFNNSFN